MKHIYIFACTLLCFPVFAKSALPSPVIPVRPNADFLMIHHSQTVPAWLPALTRTDSVPCYDRLEADMLLAGIAFVKDAVFAGGAPGLVRCATQWGTKVANIEKQFRTCMETRYPGSVSKKD